MMTSSKQGKRRNRAQPSWKAAALEDDASAVIADKTSVYVDIVQVQSVLVKLYFFLPFVLILLVSQVRHCRRYV